MANVHDIEVWLTIPVDVNYEASSFGRIRRKKTGRLLGLRPHKMGYFQVCLSNHSKHKWYYAHRLVAAAFFGISELQVNHKNMNRRDNRVENLEYVTGEENHEHARLVRESKGLDHPNAKATRREVQEIRQFYMTARLEDVAEKFGLERSTVWKIRTRRTWKDLPQVMNQQ